MEVKIRMQHGLANDMCLVIPKNELKDCLLSVPGWEWLRQSYGMVRYPMKQIPEDVVGKRASSSYDPEVGEWKVGGKGIERYKIPPSEHLGKTVQFPDTKQSPVPGLDLLDSYGRPTRRVVLIGNRNLGNNFWSVAWHKDKEHRCFHLKSEPVSERTYTCLTRYKDGHLGIEAFEFRPEGDDYHPYRASNGEDLSEEIEWCTYGQQVLRDGKLVDVEDIIDQFYDIRHVLYFPTSSEEGKRELQEFYKGYPGTFRKRALDEWRNGRPRSRYIHNAVGIGPDKIILLQRHGTIEEIGQWLKDEGAEDGLLLDNGGSVFTWAWWPITEVFKEDGKDIRITGDLIFNAPDWRPPTVSLLAFVLKGPPRLEEPRGSVSFAVV